MFALRTGGLLTSAWLLSGLFAGSYVNADRRWVIGCTDWFLLPWWLAVLWCWSPVRRPGWFFLAATTAAFIIAARFAARFYEVDPDLGRDEARSTGFGDAIVPCMIAVVIASVAVWFLHKRAAMVVVSEQATDRQRQ
jgi:hypothetical protein